MFHAIRAIRQMGLQYESYLQIVCFWLGNSHQIAQQSCMLLSEDDFGRASVVAKLIVRGGTYECCGEDAWKRAGVMQPIIPVIHPLILDTDSSPQPN